MRRHDSGSWVRDDDPGEPTTGHPRLSVTDGEADRLAELVAGLRVVEFGTGLGVSTRALARTAEFVATIDPDPWVQANVWPDLPDNVVGFASADEVVAAGHVFSAAFIDGDHAPDSVRRDVKLAESLCGPGALLLAHDTNYARVRKGLGAGWEFLQTEHGIGLRWLA